MTQINQDISLQNFYVYNSAYGPKEGEEENKILYYYPPNADIDTKVKNVGLSEAIIQFTNTFSANDHCESMHTQKARHLLFQPENKFWMVMTVNVPCVSKTKDNTTYYEYHGDDVQDIVYRAVIKQAYDMYRLFKGSFENALIGETKEMQINNLKLKLDHFFSKYLQTLKLPHCDILDVMRGIQLMPLDQLNFLKVQNFVNLLEATFSVVSHSAFLYNDQLVWSGIDPKDMQIVYHYLVSSLLPVYMETELQGGSIPRNSSSLNTPHYGRFVTGLASMKETNNISKINRVYLKDGSIYHLVVYRALSATLCLFIDGSKTLDNDLFLELNSFMGPQLTTIASEIAEKCAILANNQLIYTGDMNPRYLYFNQINLAIRSTIHRDNRKCGNINVTPEILRLIADLHSDSKSLTVSGETVLKTLSDYWLIGRLSNQRHFYVVIQQKNANLIDINNEVKKICDSQLKNIFFHPT